MPKNVLLISPNKWGDIHLSKHLYAMELAKIGYKVFFLNPPSRSISNIYEVKKIKENLYVINYKLLIPGRLKEIMPKIYYIYMIWVVNRISKLLDDKIFMTIDFSNTLTFSQTKKNYFKSTLNIFFPVDITDKNYCKKSNLIADMYFSVSRLFLSSINTENKKCYVLGHSLCNEMADLEPYKIKSKKKIKVGYVGSLFTYFINYTLLIKLIQKFSNIEFHFIGPYKKSDKDNNLGVASDFSNQIEVLRSLPNTFFYGVKNKTEIINICKDFQAMLICYFSYGEHPKATDNPHKILEYFAMGKPVISNYLEEFLSYNNDMVFMPNNLNSNSLYMDNFHSAIQKIDKINHIEYQKRRIKFANSKLYKDNTKKLLKFAMESIGNNSK